MATVCRAKNKATCKVHGMGGPVERLEIDKAKAVRTGNFAAQYEIQKQIDALKDDDPNAPDDTKANFFGKLGQKFFNKKPIGTVDSSPEPVQVSASEENNSARAETQPSLESSSHFIGHTLLLHGVFGDTDGSPATANRLKYQVEDFKSLVKDSASSGESSLELTYRESNTRVIVRTKMVDGNPVLESVVAFNHPHKNDMDYDSLNKDLKQAFDLGFK